jgi:hypothetical protein
MQARSEAAKKAAATRRERELEGREPRSWAEWDYIEEPIDDVGGEDADTGEAAD